MKPANMLNGFSRGAPPPTSSVTARLDSILGTARLDPTPDITWLGSIPDTTMLEPVVEVTARLDPIVEHLERDVFILDCLGWSWDTTGNFAGCESMFCGSPCRVGSEMGSRKAFGLSNLARGESLLFVFHTLTSRVWSKRAWMRAWFILSLCLCICVGGVVRSEVTSG